MIVRSIQSTHWFQSRTTAAISPRNGTTTPIRFTVRSALDIMALRFTHIRAAFLRFSSRIQSPNL